MKEVIFVLDTSKNVKWDIEDFSKELRAFIKEHKEQDIQVSLYSINQSVNCLYEHCPTNEFRFYKKNLQLNGVLDFYNSLGITLERVSDRINHLRGNKKPEEVYFCIITENYEDIESDYTKEEVNTFITYQKEDYKWNILYFGIGVKKNIQEIGIDKENIYSIDCSGDGMKKIFSTVSSKL